MGRRRLQDRPTRGKTWANMGLKDTRSIGRIVIDPANADVVYVAAQRHLWGPNAERGVFKTTDGGATWKKSLFVDENTGATDLVIDPANPAGAVSRRRISASARTGASTAADRAAGIYKTTDGGATWTKLTNGSARRRQGPHRRSRIVSPTRSAESSTRRSRRMRPRRAAGIYREPARRAARPWEKSVVALNTRPNYFSQIRVDPQRPASASTRSAPIAVSTSRMTAARRSPSCSATSTAKTTRCGSIPTTATT